jgi:hypothetical protein
MREIREWDKSSKAFEGKRIMIPNNIISIWISLFRGTYVICSRIGPESFNDDGKDQNHKDHGSVWTIFETHTRVISAISARSDILCEIARLPINAFLWLDFRQNVVNHGSVNRSNCAFRGWQEDIWKTANLIRQIIAHDRDNLQFAILRFDYHAAIPYVIVTLHGNAILRCIEWHDDVRVMPFARRSWKVLNFWTVPKSVSRMTLLFHCPGQNPEKYVRNWWALKARRCLEQRKRIAGKVMCFITQRILVCWPGR